MVPSWNTTASTVDGGSTCPLYIITGRAEDEEFGGTNAAEGSYFLGLRRSGAAVSQKVYKHALGTRYRLRFHMASRGVVTPDPILRVTAGSTTLGDFSTASRSMTYKEVDYDALSSAIEFKFENVSPNQYATIYIDNIISAPAPTIPAVCSELEVSTTMWGLSSTGIDLTVYTSGTLKFIGCTGQGCAANTFYCDDTSGDLRFGTTSTLALRALLGSIVPTTNPGCATSSQADGVVNAPDQSASATSLCSQLGYSFGSIEAVGTSDICPEIHYNSTGLTWESDFVTSSGFGKQFRCSQTTTTTTTTAFLF